MDNAGNFKRIAILVISSVLLFWGLNNYQIIFHLLSLLWGYLFPLFLGIGIAFLMNIPMRFIEKQLNAGAARAKKKISPKVIRPISLTLVSVIFLLIIFGVVMVAVPQITRTFSSLSEQIPEFFIGFQDFVQSISSKMPNISNLLKRFSLDLSNISGKITSLLSVLGEKALSSSFSLATSVFGGLVNFGLALIFAFYILMSKEKLCSQLDRTGRALLSEKRYNTVRELLALVDSSFSGFFSSQFLAAGATGILFFICLSIFRFPYAALISVLVAVASFIPVFGAFIACVIGAFLILVHSPLRALWFIVLFILLQQAEGTFIYPRIVGSSVGLPAIWVFFAVTLGGSVLNIFGMIIFIPLFSVFYTLFRQFINRRYQEKGVKE